MITAQESDDRYEARMALEVLEDLKGWEEVSTAIGDLKYECAVRWLKRVIERAEHHDH